MPIRERSVWWPILEDPPPEPVVGVGGLAYRDLDCRRRADDVSGMKRETLVAGRDLVIFLVKLSIDASKDGVLFFGALGAAGLDLVFGLEGNRRLFYKVMKAGERFDHYLNLHGALKTADPTKDGLFGASKAGSDTLLGKMEMIVRGGDEPRGGIPPDHKDRN